MRRKPKQSFCQHFARTVNLQNRMQLIVSTLGLVILATTLGCRSHVIHNDPVPKHDEFTMDSVATSEPRNINVYLPPGYSAGELAYPVLYMPDGGIKEDFPHIANTIDALIQRGEISPLILVGVENTNRRLDMTSKSDVEYDLEIASVNGGSTAFRKFFVSELRPEIEKRYRCNGETALVGESLAGLFVIETMVAEPDSFDRYIAFDPSLWWKEGSLVKEAENTFTKEPDLVLWFASSDASDIVTHVERLASILSESEHEGIRWKYKPNPAEQHSTIFRAEKENAFRWALWKPTPSPE